MKHNFYQEEQDQLIHGKEKSTVQKSSNDGETKTKEEPTGVTQIILITQRMVKIVFLFFGNSGSWGHIKQMTNMIHI